MVSLRAVKQFEPVVGIILIFKKFTKQAIISINVSMGYVKTQDSSFQVFISLECLWIIWCIIMSDCTMMTSVGLSRFGEVRQDRKNVGTLIHSRV